MAEANADFYIAEGDTLPALEATLVDALGVAVDLTNATSLKFTMRQIGATAVKVNTDATFVERLTGKVKYSWASPNTDTAGLYRGRFKVGFSGGAKESFPSKGYILIEISKD